MNGRHCVIVKDWECGNSNNKHNPNILQQSEVNPTIWNKQALSKILIQVP